MQFPAVGFVLVKKLYHIQSEEYSHGKEHKKKPAEGNSSRALWGGGYLLPRGLYGAAATYSPTPVRAVPSAQARLTSLFGMGRGWSTPL